MVLRFHASKILKSLALLLLFSALWSCSKPEQASSALALKVTVGQKLTEFSLKDVDGNPVQFSPATGKFLILNLWATWCGPCRHELPSLDGLQQRLGDDKALVIGISSDTDKFVLKEFLIDRQVKFKSYWDFDQSITNNLIGIRVFPSTLLIDQQGRLVKIVEGWREWDNPDLVAEIQRLMQKPIAPSPS